MSTESFLSGSYDKLKSESIMLIGEKYPTRVVWLQLYMTDSFDEDMVRQLMVELGQHIAGDKVPSGSARKFLDGKLIYYEVPTDERDRCYAIFTNQIDNIYSDVKKAVKAVATRGGVYSAQRFFTEMIEIIDNPERLSVYESLPTSEALVEFTDEEIKDIELNELGLLISHADQTKELDQTTLEWIYFHIYQRIQELDLEQSEGQIDGDPDEFLDAAYVVSIRYQETDNFHLALELYKLIIPVAQRNLRYDLEAAARIQIATIYKNYFPMSGQYILDALNPIDNIHLEETNNKMLEIYHCLLGHAYDDLEMEKESTDSFNRAINVTDQDINSPEWIADAYYFLGTRDQKNYYLKDANRHFLTAASIAFSSGQLGKADDYRHSASEIEIQIANSLIHASLIHRMEMDHKDAEYRAWEALRILIKAHLHCIPDQFHSLKVMAEEILYHARIILKLPGKQKTNREILDSISGTLTTLYEAEGEKKGQKESLLSISKVIEENIPLAPPTFILLSVDGRMMTMGLITDDGWAHSDIEGTLLSGVLSAIMSLMSEVSVDESSLRTIDAGSFQIMIEQTENIMAVLLVDRDILEFRKRLAQVLKYIDTKMGDELKYWDGGTKIFDTIRVKVQELLAPSIVAANMDS